MNKIFLIFSLLLYTTTEIYCQSFTSSPYSMFGLGRPENGESSRNSGLGGTGIGMRTDDHLNLMNPASFSKLENSIFYFDLGVSMRHYRYHSGNQKQHVSEGNLNRIIMGFKPLNKWGIAFGIAPVTSVGYKIVTSNFIEGTTDKEDITFKGSGGISKLFIGNAFQLTPSLTLGLNTSYIFGAIYHDEIQSNVAIYEKSYAAAFYADMGIQYENKLKGKFPFTIGLVYGTNQKIQLKNEIEIKGADESVIVSETLAKTSVSLPEFIGIGINLSDSKKWSIGADYLYQDWSMNSSVSSNLYYTKQHRLSAGVQYSPNQQVALNIFERMHYRMGISVENSYLKIKNQNPLLFRTTLGTGIPLKKKSMINVSLIWEEDNAYGNSIISTSTFKINLGFSLSETWFMKRKFD